MRNGPVCLLLWWLCSSVAWAQVGAPAERYPDPDPAARFAPAADPGDRNAKNTIERVLRREPNNVDGRVQRGLMYYAMNQPSRGRADFLAAIGAAAPGSAEQRYARWNFGWALFESADPLAALEQWQLAARDHGGAPYWLPAVTALVLWMQGDRATAATWYGAAVSSDPSRWASADALDGSTAGWPVNARFTLESVRQEWAARR